MIYTEYDTRWQSESENRSEQTINKMTNAKRS